MTDDEMFLDGMSKCDPDDITSASWLRLIALARIGAAVKKEGREGGREEKN